MLLFGCVANFFPSTVEKEHSDVGFVVSNTLAQDNRERLLSFGCTYVAFGVVFLSKPFMSVGWLVSMIGMSCAS